MLKQTNKLTASQTQRNSRIFLKKLKNLGALIQIYLHIFYYYSARAYGIRDEVPAVIPPMVYL